MITEKIELLAADPLALSANLKRLTGRDDYRLRIQDWRVVFRLEENVLCIDEITPRGSAYED